MDVTRIKAHHLIQGSFERKEFLSLTDVKTYSIVVLSYLLIGIGLLIACSSPYIAFTIHPMVAMAAPVVPIALGVLGLERLGQRDTTPFFKPTLSTNGAPPGISNTNNNCWIIAVLQLMCNAPYYKKAFNEINTRPLPEDDKGDSFVAYMGMRPLLSAYFTYHHTKKPTCPINAQKLREWLCKGNPDISLDRQEDPIALLEFFHSKMGCFLPLKQQIDSGEIKECQEFIIPTPPDESRTFTEVFGEFFQTKTDRGATIKRWFTIPPEGFVIQSKCFNYTPDKGQIKVAGETEFPAILKLTKDQCPSEQASYTPDAFVVHHGMTISGGGHYTAYVKRSGKWWHLDDDLPPKQVSTGEAKTKRQSAYLIHYKKYLNS